METQARTPKNKVAADLEAWDKMEAGLTKRYGAEIWKDKDSLKVKRDMIQHILNKHRNTKKTLEERAEYRIGRAYVKSINRQLYPNPWLRFVRNLAFLVANIVMLPVRVLDRIAGAILSSSPRQAPVNHFGAKTTVPERKSNSQDKSEGVGRTSGITKTRQDQGRKEQKEQTANKAPANSQQKSQAKTQTQKAVIHKMNPRQVSATPPRGMHR